MDLSRQFSGRRDNDGANMMSFENIVSPKDFVYDGDCRDWVSSYPALDGS